MLKPTTTFIVGAGASSGLPIASQLARDAQGLQPRDEIYQLLGLIVDGRHSAINRLLDNFRLHDWPSIDAFIERRQQHTEMVTAAKLLLAALMGKAMAALARARATTSDAPKDDWLRRIVNFMADGAATAKEFEQKNAKATFITFNFDTMIEAGMRRLLGNIYAGEPVEHIQSACRVIEVIHIHGVLQQPPEGKIVFQEVVSQQWITWTTAAAPAVHVTIDEIDPAIIQSAKDAIHSARILCFLGFGFDNDNVSKLDLPAIVDHRIYRGGFASAYKLSPAKRARISERLSSLNLSLGGEDDRCLDLLNKHDVLRD